MNLPARLAFLLAMSVAAWAAEPARKAPPWEKPNRVARDLYLENCSVCHDLTKPKSAKIGPSLVRLRKAPPAAREPLREYIMLKIRSGGARMPKFADVLTGEQIRLLAAYLLPR